MKSSLSKQLFTAAVIGTLSQTVVASDSCEDVWGNWCDVNAFLTQQEPTASGGLLGGAPSSATRTVTLDASEFGGSIAESDGYTEGWVGYATYREIERGINGYQNVGLAALTLELDENDNLISVKGIFDNGEVIDVTAKLKGSSFREDIGTNKGYIQGSIYGGEENGDFRAYHYSKPNKRDYTYAFIGKATPAVDMKNLKNVSAKMNYHVYSRAYINSGFTTATSKMTVEFGSGSWNMDGYLGGVNASGTVSGNTFKSNSLTATGNLTNRTIQNGSAINGTFVGAGANKLVGQANIKAVHNTNSSDIHQIRAHFNGFDVNSVR